MRDPLLSQERRVALDQEIHDTAVLLGRGLQLLRADRFLVTEAAPVFACLAIGAEKLCKLTVGIVELEEHGRWPDQATMRGQYGHQVVRLDIRARQAITGRLAASTAPGHVQHLLQSVEGDAALALVLHALDHYARAGRFANLDALAERPQAQPTPAQLWEGVVTRVLAEHPHLLAQLAAASSYPAAREGVNGIVAEGLATWWQLYYRAWVTGVLGSRARACGPGLRPR